MAIAALVIGLGIMAQGVIGLAFPDAFVGAVTFMQTPPTIYAAAVIRVAFGVVLFRAATESRAPIFLRALGALITIGGLLTPFFGIRLGEVILDSWSAGGPAVVRAWAAGSLIIGGLIVSAVAPRRRVP